jgi:hypothetical protein
MTKDAIADAYEKMILTESDLSSKDNTVGNIKPDDDPAIGDVDLVKGGPDGADIKKPVDAGEKRSPVKPGVGKAEKPTKKVTQVAKESTVVKKSFMDLYKNVISEADIESPAYNDKQGDFPPAAGEEAAADPLSDEEALGGDEGAAETDVVTLLQDIKDKFEQLISAFQAEEGTEEGMPSEDDMGGAVDPTMPPPPVGEAVSEPEPKILNKDGKSLQAQSNMKTTFVKKSTGKAVQPAAKKRTGELDTAPKGTPVGGSNKVAGKGPAHNKGASMLED